MYVYIYIYTILCSEVVILYSSKIARNQVLACSVVFFACVPRCFVHFGTHDMHESMYIVYI